MRTSRKKAFAQQIAEACLDSLTVLADNSMSARESVTAQFGAELYELRVAAKMTQAQVAKTVGLTRSYYGLLENSKRPPPPLHTLRKLFDALGVTVERAIVLRGLAETQRQLERQQKKLRRDTVVHPEELPAPVAKLVRGLAKRAHELSPRQLAVICSAYEEAIAM